MIYTAAIAALIVGTDFAAGLIGLLLLPGFELFGFVSGISILEFGVLILMGGCLGLREPLDESHRYDDEGRAVLSYKLAVTGRRLVLVGLFVFLYGMIATIPLLLP